MNVNPTDSAQTLVQAKQKEEIESLKLENEKLILEVRDAQRPYLLRNARLLTTLIVTLGILVGLAVAIQKDYLGIIMSGGDLALKEASLRKRQADTAKTDAEKARANAKVQEELAAALTKHAQTQIVIERKQVDSAMRAVEIAQDDLRRANREMFQESGFPEYVYKQQAQLSAFGIETGLLYNYGWVTTSGLRSLSCPVRDDDGLRSIPRSVQELAITVGGTPVDLSSLQNIQGLRRLVIHGYASGAPFSLGALAKATSLEDLTLDLFSGKLSGIGALQSLPRLRRLSITTTHVDEIPIAVMQRLSALRLIFNRESPLKQKEYIQIAKSTNLKTLAVYSQTTSSDLQTLLAAPNLTELTYRAMLPVAIGRTEIFPQILKLQTSIDTSTQFTLIANMFPNLRSLALFLNGQYASSYLQELVDTISKGYPDLQSLSIQGPPGSVQPENIEFPAFSRLESLRLSLPPSPLRAGAVTFGMGGLEKLHTLNIDEPNLKRDEMAHLGSLTTLVLNNVSDVSSISRISELRNLRTLGLAFSELNEDRVSRYDDKISVMLNEVLNSLSLKKLLLGYALEHHVGNLPSSIEALYIYLRGPVINDPFDVEAITYF
jgi:hypothetical protein